MLHLMSYYSTNVVFNSAIVASNKANTASVWSCSKLEKLWSSKVPFSL